MTGLSHKRRPLFRRALRLGLVYSAGFLAALAVFGLLLAGLWAIPAAPGAVYKLSGLWIAAAGGLTAGAYLAARYNKPRRFLSAILFAGLLGGCSSLYLIGPDPRLWLLLPAAAACGAAGGFLVKR